MSGECQTKNRNDYDEEKDSKPIKSLDEGSLSRCCSNDSDL